MMSASLPPDSANPLINMKIYGHRWQEQYSLTSEEAAKSLASLGVNEVTLHNRLAPVGEQRFSRTGSIRQDQEFRQALHSIGIKTLEVLPVFFEPNYLSRYPDAAPLTADGTPAVIDDWYLGMCPTHPGRIAERAAMVDRLIETYEPDGIVLDWIRHPVFWERLTPSSPWPSDPPCCCTRCGGPTAPAERRCADITSAVDRLVGSRQRVSARDGVRHQTRIIANIVPFLHTPELTGQCLADLDEIVDGFSLMLYHQVLGREPLPWIEMVIAEALAQTSKPVSACLQVAPAYLGDSYRAEGRSPRISVEDHRASLLAVRRSGAHSLTLYHWEDYLAAEANNNLGLRWALADYRDSWQSTDTSPS